MVELKSGGSKKVVLYVIDSQGENNALLTAAKVAKMQGYQDGDVLCESQEHKPRFFHATSLNFVNN